MSTATAALLLSPPRPDSARLTTQRQQPPSSFDDTSLVLLILHVPSACWWHCLTLGQQLHLLDTGEGVGQGHQLIH